MIGHVVKCGVNKSLMRTIPEIAANCEYYSATKVLTIDQDSLEGVLNIL